MFWGLRGSYKLTFRVDGNEEYGLIKKIDRPYGDYWVVEMEFPKKSPEEVRKIKSLLYKECL